MAERQICSLVGPVSPVIARRRRLGQLRWARWWSGQAKGCCAAIAALTAVMGLLFAADMIWQWTPLQRGLLRPLIGVRMAEWIVHSNLTPSRLLTTK